MFQSFLWQNGSISHSLASCFGAILEESRVGMSRGSARQPAGWFGFRNQHFLGVVSLGKDVA